MASLRDLQRRLKTLEQAPATKAKQAPPVVRVNEWGWHECTINGYTFQAPGIAAGMAERYPNAVLIVGETLPAETWQELAVRHHRNIQEAMKFTQQKLAETTKKPR